MIFAFGKEEKSTNFNNMTLAWHLNHSDTPNVLCDPQYNFITTRKINKGEEILADYRTYDNRPLNF